MNEPKYSRIFGILLPGETREQMEERITEEHVAGDYRNPCDWDGVDGEEE